MQPLQFLLLCSLLPCAPSLLSPVSMGLTLTGNRRRGSSGRGRDSGSDGSSRWGSSSRGSGLSVGGGSGRGRGTSTYDSERGGGGGYESSEGGGDPYYPDPGATSTPTESWQGNPVNYTIGGVLSGVDGIVDYFAKVLRVRSLSTGFFSSLFWAGNLKWVAAFFCRTCRLFASLLLSWPSLLLLLLSLWFLSRPQFVLGIPIIVPTSVFFSPMLLLLLLLLWATVLLGCGCEAPHSDFPGKLFPAENRKLSLPFPRVCPLVLKDSECYYCVCGSHSVREVNNSYCFRTSLFQFHKYAISSAAKLYFRWPVAASTTNIRQSWWRWRQRENVTGPGGHLAATVEAKVLG